MKGSTITILALAAASVAATSLLTIGCGSNPSESQQGVDKTDFVAKPPPNDPKKGKMPGPKVKNPTETNTP